MIEGEEIGVFLRLNIPESFRNIGVSEDNNFIADTNDSSDFKRISIPLPRPIGKWAVNARNRYGEVILNDVSSEMFHEENNEKGLVSKNTNETCGNIFTIKHNYERLRREYLNVATFCNKFLCENSNLISDELRLKI